MRCCQAAKSRPSVAPQIAAADGIADLTDRHWQVIKFMRHEYETKGTTWAGGLPGVSSVMTHYMNHKMSSLDIPSIPEFIEMIADTGAGLYGCKASVGLFGLTRDDLIGQVKDIITVGEFYDLAAGGEIIFT
jgi:peroxiredoxin family protein